MEQRLYAAEVGAGWGEEDRTRRNAGGRATPLPVQDQGVTTEGEGQEVPARKYQHLLTSTSNKFTYTGENNGKFGEQTGGRQVIH